MNAVRNPFDYYEHHEQLNKMLQIPKQMYDTNVFFLHDE